MSIPQTPKGLPALIEPQAKGPRARAADASAGRWTVVRPIPAQLQKDRSCFGRSERGKPQGMCCCLGSTSSMPPTPRQRQGRWAEQRALRLLEAQGWRLVSRNWRCRWGELDLVCEKPGRLLLVEVKGRRPEHRDGAGSVALRGRQRRRLGRAWACWLVDHPERATWPVEFVAALVPLPPAAGGVRWLRLEG